MRTTTGIWEKFQWSQHHLVCNVSGHTSKPTEEHIQADIQANKQADGQVISYYEDDVEFPNMIRQTKF